MASSCEYIFRRGKNSGSACGKKSIVAGKYCPLHAEKVLELQALPSEIINIIVDNLVASKVSDVKKLDRLEALEQTCNEFRSIVADKYAALYATLCITGAKDEAMTRRGLRHKDRCRLLLHTGCQSCKTPRITKIHWPFPTRLCSECVGDIVVADYELPEYRVYNFSNREFLVRGTYSRYHGASSYRLFLRSDVERSIGHKLHEFPGVYAAQVAERKSLIADALETTVEALTARSATFSGSDTPDRTRVTTEHWQSLANEAFVAKVSGAYDGKAKIDFAKLFPVEAGMIGSVSDVSTFCAFEAHMAASMGVHVIAREIERHQNSKYVKNAAAGLLRTLRECAYFSRVTDLPPNIASMVHKAGEERRGSMSEAKAQVLKHISDHVPDCTAYFTDPIYVRLFLAEVKYPDKAPVDFARFAQKCMHAKGYVHGYSLPTAFASWQDAIDFINDSTHPYKSRLHAYNAQLAKMFDEIPYFKTFPDSEKPEIGTTTFENLDEEFEKARARAVACIAERLPPHPRLYFPDDSVAIRLFHESVRYPNKVPEPKIFLSRYISLKKLHRGRGFESVSCWDDMLKYLEDHKRDVESQIDSRGMQTCRLCGTSRYFTHVGLRDHTRAMHNE